jgi:hypothetical protein
VTGSKERPQADETRLGALFWSGKGARRKSGESFFDRIDKIGKIREAFHASHSAHDSHGSFGRYGNYGRHKKPPLSPIL